MPSCAMIASRRACALVKVASVATTTSVVFSPAWPLVAEGERLLRNGGGQAAPAEFAVALERRRPEMRPAADHAPSRRH